MKLVAMFLAVNLTAAAASAAPHRCTAEIDRQEHDLAQAFDDSADYDTNANVIQHVNEGSDMEQNEVDALLELLRRTDTIAFEWENDMGYFVTVAENDTCKVIQTFFVLGY
jgi:hypothetical protein